MYILMDVGGTEIKCSLFGADGQMLGSVCHFPSKAGESREGIFSNLADILETLEEQGNGEPVAGVGMAFPGPFDYEKGISRMQGIGKFDAIYGCPIAEEMQKRRPSLAGSEFLFLHDVEAFAVGVSRMGQAKHHKKIFCVCIGTGAGSAFVADGKIKKKKEDGVPEHGWIYNTPFRESIIDDYLSVRGLSLLAKQVTGEVLSGKELYERCQRGDELALKTFWLFGEDLLLALLPFLETFAPDAIVIGGQIGKSLAYFGKQLKAVCDLKKIALYQETDTSVLAMQGLLARMCGEGGGEDAEL